MLLTVDPTDRESSLVDVPLRTFGTLPDDIDEGVGTPTGTPPAATATLLTGETEGPRIVQVVVTEGGARGLVWIGVEEIEEGSPTVDAVLVATTATYYQQCGMSRRPPSAAAVHVDEAGPFRATLEVEPEHFTDMFGESAYYEDGYVTIDGPRCPWNAEVRWRSERGFIVKETPGECTGHRPRVVEIGDDGELRAVRAPELDP